MLKYLGREVLLYNLLLGIQWFFMIAGLIGAPALTWFYSPTEGLLSLIVSLLALANLKLDVVSLAG